MHRSLKIGGVVLLGLLMSVAVALPFTIGLRPIIGPKARPLTDRRFEVTPARLERGRYLVTAVNGCLVCHSERDWRAPGFPVKPGTEGAGHVWNEEGLPFVTAPNITPDPETGAGTWTDDMLARAIREGIGHDGRTLFPMMPYQQFRQMADEDLASVVVYLRSLPPIKRALPKTQMPFPVSRLVNAVPEPVVDAVPSPDRSDPVAYGRYLVQMASCRECHTPRDDRGEPLPALQFAGGQVFTGPYGQVASRNITQDPSGIPYYDADFFVEVIRTGMAKARKIHDEMPWAVFRRQTDEDLRAIFAFLQTVPAVTHRVDNALPPTPCPVCRGAHGAGEQNAVATASERQRVGAATGPSQWTGRENTPRL